MPQITIGDVTESAQINISNLSLLGRHQISQLKTTARNVLSLFSQPMSNPDFHRAEFSSVFKSPSVDLGGITAGAKAGVNSVLTVSRAADTPLFGKDDYDPIAITGKDCWMSFELDTQVVISASASLPDGFGVGFTSSAEPVFTAFVRIPGGQESLKDAIEQTLNSFDVPISADDVLQIPEGRIYSIQLQGTLEFSGSWSLPLSVNQLVLASADLPFHSTFTVSPSVTLGLAGAVTLSSGFTVRIRRVDANRIRLGVCRSKGSTLEASFTAAAGVTADLCGKDLISALFTALDSKIDLSVLSSGDADKIGEVVKDSVDRSLSVSINAACSGAESDEAAIAFDIDVSAPDDELKKAIAVALQGDWTQLAGRREVTTLRNVIAQTLEKNFSLTVNLLGLYNYRSVADFVAAMKVLKSEDGSVTITDTATATRLAAASTPLAVDSEQLRGALYESFVATATYKALEEGVGVTSSLAAAQDFFLYKASMDYRQALKQLNAGLSLGVMAPEVKIVLPASGPAVHHARFAASCRYAGDTVLRFFFSDVSSLRPRTAGELEKIGRAVLAGLLDPQDETDRKRIVALQSDAFWAKLDADPVREAVPPYYSDWMDIRGWSKAIAEVGPLLADAIRFGRALAGDPSQNAEFMEKRSAVAQALLNATRRPHAAFEHAFPLCVMATLARPAVSPVFEAQWNSKTIFSNARPAAQGAK